MKNLSEAQIYVGTYAKYNNGSIFGEWLNLSDYSNREEFDEACRELHKDEEDPEYMFQDWENIPEALIGESWMSDDIFEIIEAISDLSKSNQEAFFLWLDNGSYDLDTNDIAGQINRFHDDYQGVYQNEEEYAYAVVEECYDLPEFALRYFDYESFARDLFMSDYWFDSGHVFRHS
ncbi:antirestriction protein ArdA [Bacteroidales bacterium OttesenSCG-928-J19]|nr:antirestriction protein ArdA [Bacteroidales bacterium OttesenSCG-928-J19]